MAQVVSDDMQPPDVGVYPVLWKAAIWVDPGRCGGTPCIAGTRLTTPAIAWLVWKHDVDRVLDLYPELTRTQVRVACWYDARCGTARHPWREWARHWQDTDPPTRGDDA
jgi:uncharacterized protein (DUF433 family)